MQEIIVPLARVPVLEECDVLVCGGGPAGCAAAITASRQGAKTVLIERWSFPGGMGTASLLGQFHTSDREKQVIRGIMQELIDRGISKGYCEQLDHYPTHHDTHNFDIEGLKILYEELLVEAGVKLFYTLTAGDVITEGDRIKAVLCDTKTGRKAIKAKLIIDATGDGDIAAKAGVPFSYGRQEDGLVQGMTMIYKLIDIDKEQALAITTQQHQEIINKMRELTKKGEFPPFGPISFGYYAKGGYPNMCPVKGNPLHEDSMAQCNITARKQIEEYVKYFQQNVPGFQDVKLAFSAPSMGIRESRRIHGKKTLTEEDVTGCKKQDDAIGHGCWMIDIHDPKGSGYTTWQDSVGELPVGRSYHIPYNMMVPVKIDNLLVAGRCASSTHKAHASVRVMSHCLVMGQAAGTAAGMALNTGVNVSEVDIYALQKKLKEDGVYLEPET